MEGLLGKKIGMMSIFDATGQQVGVTLIECGPCVVLQRKKSATDGYEAVQLGFGEAKEKNVNKAQLAVYKKIGITPPMYRAEVKVEKDENLNQGDKVTVQIFEKTPYVDIIGISKGKGFQGVVRRHGMGGGPMTHGGHSKRRIGSIGCRELPGKIHKGKRMPGHMGHERVTIQNLKVQAVRPDANLLVVEGSIPGHNGAIVLIKKSIKKKA